MKEGLAQVSALCAAPRTVFTGEDTEAQEGNPAGAPATGTPSLSQKRLPACSCGWHGAGCSAMVEFTNNILLNIQGWKIASY